MKNYLCTLAIVSLVTACDSTTPTPRGAVTVRFNTVNTAAVAASGANDSVAFDHVPAGGAITITGSNGTLVIHDIRLIVSEFELKRAEDACVGEDDNDSCEEFEGGPFLVNLLDGSAVDVVNAAIPEGTYTKLEFEVEDLDGDSDDDTAERTTMQAILASMRQAYPNFPSRASGVVHGTFTPTGGTAQVFTVYLDAEIEVEVAFAAPFRVPQDGKLSVDLSPAAWFKVGSTVTDLRALNGQTISFDAEFSRGVMRVRDDD